MCYEIANRRTPPSRHWTLPVPRRARSHLIPYLGRSCALLIHVPRTSIATLRSIWREGTAMACVLRPGRLPSALSGSWSDYTTAIWKIDQSIRNWPGSEFAGQRLSFSKLSALVRAIISLRDESHFPMTFWISAFDALDNGTLSSPHFQVGKNRISQGGKRRKFSLFPMSETDDIVSFRELSAVPGFWRDFDLRQRRDEISGVLAEMFPINLKSLPGAIPGIKRKILSPSSISIFCPCLSTCHTRSAIYNTRPLCAKLASSTRVGCDLSEGGSIGFRPGFFLNWT
jgi:hypothetical protein